MSVLRVKKTENFVILHKGALENPNLSFKAKGLWAYCMSRPDSWEFHVSHLATVSKDGEDSVYSAIRELIVNGYCERVQENNGKFGKVDYYIHETPINIKEILPQPDFPRAESSGAGNPALLSIDSSLSIEKESKRASPPNPPPPPEKIETFFESGKVKMKSEALASLVSDFGDSKVKEMIGRLNEYAEIKPKKFKEYGNHAMVIRKWIREDLDKGGAKPAIQSRAEDLAMKVEEAFPNHPYIRYGRGYIEFISGQGSTHVKFTDANSDGIIESFLRKMNIWGRIGKL